MLLRSSSTPILGSLLPSFSESPSHPHSDPHPTIKHQTPPPHHQQFKPSLPFNCSSSPLTRCAVELSDSILKRSTSEGNLVGLAANTNDHSSSPLSRPSKGSQKRSSGSVLKPNPSFSFHDTPRCENEDSDDDVDFGKAGLGGLENSYMGVKTSDDIRFVNERMSLAFLEENTHNAEMYLARGLGVDNLNIGFGGSGGGGGNFVPVAYGRGGGDDKRQGAEEHYKNLVEENPGNPLFLRNYAHFLFESKKDLEKSEELYSRAILADPGDGEVLSQYAKLIWELHHDKDRALNYFRRAIQVAPADSHVQAAFASFLWAIDGKEDDDEDESVFTSSIFTNFHKEVMAT